MLASISEGRQVCTGAAASEAEVGMKKPKFIRLPSRLCFTCGPKLVPASYELVEPKIVRDKMPVKNNDVEFAGGKGIFLCEKCKKWMETFPPSIDP